MAHTKGTSDKHYWARQKQKSIVQGTKEIRKVFYGNPISNDLSSQSGLLPMAHTNGSPQPVNNEPYLSNSTTSLTSPPSFSPPNSSPPNSSPSKSPKKIWSKTEISCLKESVDLNDDVSMYQIRQISPKLGINVSPLQIYNKVHSLKRYRREEREEVCI